MGLTDLKFTETDFLNKKIADLSDTPNSDGMSAAELKAYFDYIPKTLIALTRLNSIIDIISGSSGAENVGASTITGVTGITAQAILESLKSLIDLRYTKNETDNLLSFKATNETVSQLIKNVDFDEDTGKFTFTFESGNTKEIDTAMEKIAVNFSYDPDTQSLVLEYVDGTTETISLAEFITNNEFEDSNTIDFTVTEGIVKAEIKLGSITDDMLSSALLTTLAGYVSSAAGSAQEAASSETNAGTYEQTASAAAQTATQKAKNAADSASEASSNANKSKSYAVGGTGTREGEDTDNSQYYSNQANLRANAAALSAQEAKEAAATAIGFDYKGAWDSSTSYTAGQLVSYSSTLWTAKKGNLNSIPYEGSQDWEVFVGLPSVLDLGTFTDETLAAHIMNANAHQGMTLDANNPAITTQETLEEHEKSSEAHGNINIDGGGQ